MVSLRILFALVFNFLAAASWAACSGTDLRASLDEAQRSEIAARLDGVPYAQGNHWIARRGARQLNLIGTLHLTDPRMEALTARLAPVIRAADLLLVEATLEDQAKLKNDLASKPELILLTGPSLIDRLPPETWQTLADALQARGMPPFMAAKFQPWFLNLMLSLPPCAMREMTQGGKGLDQRLMELAATADVPTAALESSDTLFMLMGQGSFDEQLEALELSILPVALVEDASATMINQYFEEQTVEALETSRVITRAAALMDPDEFDQQFDGFMDAMSKSRNLAWIEVIEAAEQPRIVIAAGAFHLGGEFGLLNLLAQRGYTLERAPF